MPARLSNHVQIGVSFQAHVDQTLRAARRPAHQNGVPGVGVLRRACKGRRIEQSHSTLHPCICCEVTHVATEIETVNAIADLQVNWSAHVENLLHPFNVVHERLRNATSA